MIKVKRDYLIGVKILAVIYFITILVISLLYFFAMDDSEFISGLYAFVSQIVTIGTATISATPAVIIFCITPIDLKFDDGLVPTMHLPLSKKQILSGGLKSILPYFIIWIIATNLITTVLKTNISNEGFSSLYLGGLFNNLSVVAFTIIIDLQVMAATILAYAKDINWYKIVPIQTILNIIVVIISYFTVVLMKVDTVKNSNWLILIGVGIAIFSIIEFLYSFRYIEEVCR